MQDVSRILILKHGALGDIIQGFDSFASVRARFPHAQITVLTTAAFAGLLRSSGWFDEVVIDKRAGLGDIRSHFNLIRFLRRDWDYVLDMQCSKRTGKYALFKAKHTRWFGISTAASDRLPDFTGINNADRMLITAEQIGASRLQADLGWLTSAALPAIAENLSEQKFAVLFAGCSLAKPQKRWSAARFADVAAALKHNGIRPVLAGTAQDRDANDAVMASCPDSVDLTAQTNLLELAALCARAECVVGNDTGPVFLSAKCGTPTIMVMGKDTDPEMSAPKGAQARYVRAPHINDVTSEQVLQEIQELGVF